MPKRAKKREIAEGKVMVYLNMWAGVTGLRSPRPAFEEAGALGTIDCTGPDYLRVPAYFSFGTKAY